MPWIMENDCTGCGICVKKCTADAITIMGNQKAVIDDSKCVRCGICHDVCPKHAVAHDSEKVPALVSANIEDASKKIDFCGERLGAVEREKALERFLSHYRREIAIAEKTIKGIDKLRKASA